MERRSGYFKKIDFVFFNVRKIKDAVMDEKFGGVARNNNGSGVSDPTAAAVMHHMLPIRVITINGSQLEWPEKWLHMVDMVYTMCDESHMTLLNARYGGENYKKTCRRMSIAQSTYSKMWSRIRHYQELCAVQEGLVRIF